LADRVVGVTWLSFPLGVVCALAVCAVAIFGGSRRAGGRTAAAAAATASDDTNSFFAWGVALHGLAAVVELAVEPLYVAVTARLEFGLRAGVESAAAVVRCLATLALLVLGGGAEQQQQHQPHLFLLLCRIGRSPALTFGAAQLAASLVAAACYALHAARLTRKGELHPRAALRRGSRGQWDAQDREALRLSALFGVQAAEKLVLAEGSKLALVGVASVVAAGGGGGRGGVARQQQQQHQQRAHQGAYGLVSNLGGLVARLLLQPLEEVAFAAFSRAAADAAAADDDDDEEVDKGAAITTNSPRPAAGRRRRGSKSASQATDSKPQQPKTPQQHQNKKQQQLAAALALCLRAVSLAGLLASLLGPWYAYSALRLAYGSRWSDGPGGAPLALAAYACYVAIMAVNGVAEAFSHAVLDAKGLGRANAALVAFAALQAAMSSVAVGVSARFGGGATWGAAALVAADACGMLPRVAYALGCARRYFDDCGGGGGGEGGGGGSSTKRGGGERKQRSSESPLHLRALFPSSGSLLAVAVASALSGASWRLVLHGGSGVAAAASGASPPPPLSRVAAHVALGAALAAALAPALWLAERRALRAGADVLSGQAAKRA
jgi:oligosaccharide translocation protein RFT1